MIWSDFKLGTGNILHCCYLCLFVRSQRVIVPLIDAVSAVSLLLVPPSLTGSLHFNSLCVLFVMLPTNHQSASRHTYENAVCRREKKLVCTHVCVFVCALLEACIASIRVP